MQKPAPAYSVDLVLHPQEDIAYTHFEQAASHPFQADPAAFPRVNAWWLADCALLSYWDEAHARPIFEAAGLQSRFVRERSTDCYIAWSSQAVIVAFRGTEPDEWRDVLADVKFALVPWRAGKVHFGFKQALDDIWPQLEPAIRELSPGRTVWFCGHSLGAALAVLAADRHTTARGVCTFGCPRVGDDTFAAAFKATLGARSLRYVNHLDVVTRVPLPPVYAHVDAGRFIAPGGEVSEHAPRHDLLGHVKDLLEMVRSLKSGVLTKTQPLLDHMPKAYAIWTWNDYDAKG